MPFSSIFPHRAFVLTLFVVVLAVHALARPAVPAALPSVLFADTEVSTNVPFSAALEVSLETFSISVTPDGTAFIMR